MARRKCAESENRLISLEMALAHVRAVIRPIEGNERVGLKQAHGRVLAENIDAPFDLPPYPNSAMDGYALRCADVAVVQDARLKVVGASFAGRPFQGSVKEGECVRIFTGAAVPEGADAVIMQEDALCEGDEIRVLDSVELHENIRSAGDDIRSGNRLLDWGKRLTPADLGLLASIGRSDVTVLRKLRAAFFSTGDELRPIGEPLVYGEIHDSNRYTLAAMLGHPGIEAIDLGVVGDDLEVTKHALREAAEISDVVVTSGGVSVGEADCVAEAVRELGRVDFWKLAMKPGKPVVFGRLGKTCFFGLPGNPVAVIVTFRQIVRPALLQLMGAPVPPVLRLQAVCRSRLHKSAGRQEFQRGLFSPDGTGGFRVVGCEAQGSHRLSSMSQANCFIVLSAENEGVEPGETVEIEPFEELF
jgi:molybdopterin molybdotransferase